MPPHLSAESAWHRLTVTQKYNIDPVGTNAQYQYDALPKLEELLAETDYECEKLGVMTDLTVNFCTDHRFDKSPSISPAWQTV